MSSNWIRPNGPPQLSFLGRRTAHWDSVWTTGNWKQSLYVTTNNTQNGLVYRISRDATIFLPLDANRRYWKIEISRENSDKTAFGPYHGPFFIIRLPFGLGNTPGTFQIEIDVILSSVKWQFALVCLDDLPFFPGIRETYIADANWSFTSQTSSSNTELKRDVSYLRTK